MKTATDYNTEQSFGLLLVGPPKSGKTCLAMQFPSPWFLDADHNLASGKTMFPGKEFYWDDPEVDEQGQAIPKEARWDRAVALIKDAIRAVAAGSGPRVLVIDSLSKVATYLEDHLVTKAGTGKDLIIAGQRCMTQSHWYPFKMLMQRLVILTRSAGVPVIWIAHEKLERDEALGMFVYRPLISGQLADSIGALFTDVWRTETQSVPISEQYPTGVKYVVRAVPSAQMALGNSRGLPATFEFTYEKFEKYLKI